MDGRAGSYQGGDGYVNWSTGDTSGYEAYDYTYDYGSSSSYNVAAKSWQTSYPTSHSDGSASAGLLREEQYGNAGSSYEVTNQAQYGYSEPDVGYRSRREQRHSYPQQRTWTGSSRGGFRGNYGVPPAVRGAPRPPPLFTHGQYPEMSGFQGLRAFTGNSYFGGGFKQRTKRNWKDRSAHRKFSKEGGPPPDKKEKKCTSTEDTETKSDDSESEADADAEAAGKNSKADAEDKEEDGKETGDGEKDKEEKNPSFKRQTEPNNRRLRNRMVERIQFICSLCKFRTFYNEEMSTHLQSDFHKEHFRYVRGKLPKQIADFLEEYVTQKTKKTEERRQVISDLGTTIQQIYRDQDLTQDLGMEHFVKKVEAAHCAACDIFIPMHSSAIQRHLKSPLHNQNRRNMMDQSKKCALAVAQSILSNKLISEKLDRYIKGENPFTEDHDENMDGGHSHSSLTEKGASTTEHSLNQKEPAPKVSTTTMLDVTVSEACMATVDADDSLETPKSTLEEGDALEVPVTELVEGDALEVPVTELVEGDALEAPVSSEKEGDAPEGPTHLEEVINEVDS
ncbi:A-kinase anchor protein 8-like [Pelodytes ibericus]